MKETSPGCSKEDVPDSVLDAGTPLDAAHLFRAHGQFVASFLLRLGTPMRELDDLVQEVFMAAHRRGGYRPGPARPSTYLANLCLEIRRTHRRQDSRWRRSQDESAAEAVLGTAPPPPGSERELLDAARRLQAILMQLDEKQRAVFVLFELYDESCESIAAGLDMKLGTVYSRLHTARLAFRRLSEQSDESIPATAVRR